MSETPVEQQQYSPPVTRGGGGSVGPVIAVLAVIAILGVVAGVIGRLCSGRRIMGRGEYDVEGWVERRCSSCLDGRVAPPPRRTPEEAAAEGGGSGGESPAAEAPPEMKSEAREAEQRPHENGHGHS